MEQQSKTAQTTVAKARARKLFALANDPSAYPNERTTARDAAMRIVSAYGFDLSEFEKQPEKMMPVRAAYKPPSNPAWTGLKKSWVAHDPANNAGRKKSEQ